MEFERCLENFSQQRTTGHREVEGALVRSVPVNDNGVCCRLRLIARDVRHTRAVEARVVLVVLGNLSGKVVVLEDV